MNNRRYSEEEVREIAEELIGAVSAHDAHATVVGLSGDLGAGKTTLVKEIASLLGVQETLQSPTFVVAKFYQPAQGAFEELVHMDAYRIERAEELAPLHISDVFSKPNTLVLIEWPERIKEALPPHTTYFTIAHDGAQRVISHA